MSNLIDCDVYVFKGYPNGKFKYNSKSKLPDLSKVHFDEVFMRNCLDEHITDLSKGTVLNKHYTIVVIPSMSQPSSFMFPIISYGVDE
jgi:hypothetical protein